MSCTLGKRGWGGGSPSGWEALRPFGTGVATLYSWRQSALTPQRAAPSETSALMWRGENNASLQASLLRVATSASSLIRMIEVLRGENSPPTVIPPNDRGTSGVGRRRGEWHLGKRVCPSHALRGRLGGTQSLHSLKTRVRPPPAQGSEALYPAPKEQHPPLRAPLKHITGSRGNTLFDLSQAFQYRFKNGQTTPQNLG